MEIKFQKSDFDYDENKFPEHEKYMANYTNGKDCPLARALKREFPGTSDISVYPYHFYLGNKRYDLDWSCSPAMIQGEKFHTIPNYKFSLNIPDLKKEVLCEQ